MPSRTEQLQEIIEGFHSLKGALAYSGMCTEMDTSLSTSQWLALDLISRKEHVAIKDISLALGISSSAATQIINELVKNRYVRKHTSQSDKRMTIITLTLPTQKSITRIREHMLNSAALLFSVLSDREFATYQQLHRKLVGSLTR